MYMSKDARMAVLETTMVNISSVLIDIKHDLTRLSDKMDVKFEAMEQKFESKFEAMDRKFETKFEAIDRKFEDIDRKFAAMDQKFVGMDQKFESKFEAMDRKFDNKFDILHARLWSNFLWLISMMIGLAGLISHTQDWI